MSKTQYRILFSGAAILCCLLAISARAATCTVNSLTDTGAGAGGVGDLRYCINQTNASTGADTIVTTGPGGTILLSSSLPPITDSLTITSNSTRTIDGQNIDGIRPFDISGAITVNLNNLTIRRGASFTVGGGAGGGIRIANGATVNFTNLLIDSNGATGGGGIYADSSNLNIINSRITNNQSFNGGGIGVNDGTLTIKGSIVSNNTALKGGGMYLDADRVSIENSTVNGNSGQNDGGGVYVYNGIVKMSNVTISNNTATNGGGVFNFASDWILRNCTIAGNTATGQGGGISNFVLPMTIANTIVADNISPTGADVYTSPASLTLAGANIVETPVSGSTSGAGTINAVDPQLLPLATYGGNVATQALAIASPARNTGANAEALDTQNTPAALTTDVRGIALPAFPRFVGQVDIGAYEARQNGTAFLVNSYFNTDDGTCSAANCTLREAINAANANPNFDEVFFDTSYPAGVFATSADILLTASLPTVTRSLTIEGTGATRLAVDAQGETGVRPFTINGSGITVNLNNLTVTGGAAAEGGGISNNSATLNLTGVIVSYNEATGSLSGGGIYSYAGNLNVINSRITGNQVTFAGGYGGGMRFIAGALFMTGTTVSGNSTTNSANSRGGGLFVENANPARIENATVSGNFGMIGGGISHFATSDNSTIRLRMSNVTISSNTATTGGGLDNSSNGVVSLTNCTVAGNTASANGGGISNSYQTYLTNTIVGDNSAPSGADVSNSYIVTVSGANIVESSISGTILGLGTYSTVDPMLLPLADNGGLTNTQALMPGSPAIDVGVNSEARDTNNALLTIDQRGSSRVIDAPPLTGTPTVDIGAYELFYLAPSAATVSISGRIIGDKSRGVSGARVVLTDSSGNSRTAISTAFGFYHFDEVPVGKTYVVSVFSKRSLFAPQMVNVTNEINDLNFLSQP